MATEHWGKFKRKIVIVDPRYVNVPEPIKDASQVHCGPNEAQLAARLDLLKDLYQRRHGPKMAEANEILSQVDTEELI